MTLSELQAHLKATGRYAGAVDGKWGKLTEGGILLMLTDGPDTALTDADLQASAKRLGSEFAAIKAVTVVEANGAGFFQGRPLILPEPHRFSRATRGRFNASNPMVSYSRWGARPYPKTQDARYKVLLQMIRLDVDAGFASASYGKFQILGENHEACGYPNSMRFAEAMARDEQTQLRAFEGFVTANGLLPSLRKRDWAGFARRYNGTAYAVNKYDQKLAAAYRAAGGRG